MGPANLITFLKPVAVSVCCFWSVSVTHRFLRRGIKDTRYALRRLRMAPPFTVATILTLALGIGARTSIFTLAHAVLRKSLPVAKPDELYRVGKEARCCYVAGYSQDKEFSLVSYDLYRYPRDNTKGFVELAASRQSICASASVARAVQRSPKPMQVNLP